MAWTATWAVSTATPKVNQPVTATLTITSGSGGDPVLNVIAIKPYFTVPGLAGFAGEPVPTSSMAGAGPVAPTPLAVAPSTSSTTSWPVVLFTPLAAALQCSIEAIRVDTGATVTLTPASTVTITAS